MHVSCHYEHSIWEIRVEGFVERLGYEPVLSEKGKIAYDPDVPLDESCYREAASADIFVLIVGGRYGSAASDESAEGTRESHERYESITKKEYEAAIAKDIPTYILVNRAVYAEYETYRKNRENEGIEYAQVDSVNVFRFLDDILSKRRNNPLYQFDKHTEIEAWLREQWAGLFRELINRRSQQKELATLNERMAELKSINSSLERYMETLLRKTTPEKATEIIREEGKRRDEEKRLSDFERHDVIQGMIRAFGANLGDLVTAFRSATSLDELASKFALMGGLPPAGVLEIWKPNPDTKEHMNELRAILGLGPLVYDADE